MEKQELKIPNDLLDIIQKIIKRGNSAEVKKERDQVVVVEIQRQVRIKTTFING